ncbi:MAG: HAD family hydrolase [Syntrophaceae bacterium]
MAHIEIFGKHYDPGVVIFDKDGTLLDFKATWLGIIREFIAAIMRRTNPSEKLAQGLQKALGVFIEEREIDGGGPFAMGTAEEVNTVLAECLYHAGLRWDKAQAIIRAAEHEVLKGPIRARNLCPAQGGIELLERLKARGIRTALATNDNQADAQGDMQAIGALALLDLVVGADSVSKSKPAPDMILLICERFGLSPRQAAMIGDTLMDAQMGRNAHVMVNVGLIGTLSSSELAAHTDVVIESLDQIR